MEPSKRLSIIIDNVEVTGRVTYLSTRNIAIETIGPYPGLRNSSHSPWFSQPYYYGDFQRVPLLLLKEAYRFAKIADDNTDRLAEPLIEAKKKVAEYELLIAQLELKKQIIKKNMKAGIITSISYQQELKKIKRSVSETKWEIMTTWTTFFNLFHDVVPGVMREGLIKIIESNDLVES